MSPYPSQNRCEAQQPKKKVQSMNQTSLGKIWNIKFCIGKISGTWELLTCICEYGRKSILIGEQY